MASKTPASRARLDMRMVFGNAGAVWTAAPWLEKINPLLCANCYW